MLSLIHIFITMKDILEALVGTLPSDSEDPDIVPRKDGSWLIDGQCSFYDFLRDVYKRQPLIRALPENLVMAVPSWLGSRKLSCFSLVMPESGWNQWA